MYLETLWFVRGGMFVVYGNSLCPGFSHTIHGLALIGSALSFVLSTFTQVQILCNDWTLARNV